MMTQTSSKGVIPASPTPITKRSLSELAADKAAVKAMAQAAVNVENFTIPLYLCSMSSIYGTHALKTTPDRLWPGMVPTPTPPGTKLTPQQQAYNTIFSVFIQEMLHLQLAANLSAALGVKPKFFTGSLLQNTDGGWGCFGPDNSVIPHIIDLQDTTDFADVKVNLDKLNENQFNLFLAVEQSHDTALKGIKPAALDKYFPAVPFANWTASNTEKNLPLFGTIGWMYASLLNYLIIEYEDGKSLWEHLFNPGNLQKQRDVFNDISKYHGKPEYPSMPTKITATDSGTAWTQALHIVKGICNQGEGGEINVESYRQLAHMHKGCINNNQVDPVFQPDSHALRADYPDSPGDVDARVAGDKTDHWERFNSLKAIIDTPNLTFSGNEWTADDLKTSGYAPDPTSSLPTPSQVAQALNALKGDTALLDNLVVGSINGINSALTQSWGDASVGFPNAAMRATGSRMSLYWAVVGKAPDLSRGLPASKGDDQHACQSLSTKHPDNDCASTSIYHTCGGSNACKGQGGCGYPNKTSDGHYVAPSDNTCAQKGGCGAPISVWQLYSPPYSGTMDIVDIDSGKPIQPDTFPFSENDKVYDKAWEAYSAVMASKKTSVNKPDMPSPIRIVLPPN